MVRDMQKLTEQWMTKSEAPWTVFEETFTSCSPVRVRRHPLQTLCGGTCMVTVTMWCLKTQKHDGDGVDAQCTLSQSVESHAMNHLLSSARPARSMFADFGRTGSPMARTRRRWVGCRLGLSCEAPAAPPDRAAGARTRQPENSKRAHFRAPALQTPQKFHERTPKREKEE